MFSQQIKFAFIVLLKKDNLNSKMAFEFNLVYIKTNTRAKIIAAEAAFALLGGIMNAVSVSSGTFLGLALWTTFFISGSIVVLNICNVYEKIYARFGTLVVQCEQIYIGVWAIFYAINAILSWIPMMWGFAYLIGYLELGLFVFDGYLHHTKPRYSSENTAENLPEDQITQSA